MKCKREDCNQGPQGSRYESDNEKCFDDEGLCLACSEFKDDMQREAA
ncbi:unnamed protein product, partial [marine sediment metagenome]